MLSCSVSAHGSDVYGPLLRLTMKGTELQDIMIDKVLFDFSSAEVYVWQSRRLSLAGGAEAHARSINISLVIKSGSSVRLGHQSV